MFQLKVFHSKMMRLKLKLIHSNRLTLQTVSNSGVEVVAVVFASNHQAGVEEVQVDLEDPIRDLYQHQVEVDLEEPMRDLYLFQSC